MRHIMVDLETLGRDADSVIVSIGAVEFSVDRGIENEGYWPLDLVQPGRHLDLETIRWWLQQDVAARQVFGEERPVPLSTALDELAQAFDADTCIWVYGANFDEVILNHAYRQQHKPVPWHYRNVRCLRTLRALYPDVTILENGTKHNALVDARWQAQLLLAIVKEKGVPLR